MTQKSVRELSEGISDVLKKDVIIVTHNVHFLRARKLSFKEAIEVNKRLERTSEASNTNPSEKGASTDNKRVGNKDGDTKEDEMGRTPPKTFGNGDRPRASDPGGSDIGADTSEHTTKSVTSDNDTNEKSRQETKD